MTDYDSPWKEALDCYFQLFLALLFPQVHADIDWTRGFELLDKELQKITRAAKHGRRTVDKLVKVWLKNGAEKWLLIHVEIQARKERGFAKRVYVYNYRLFDRYDQEVISLVVLADDNPNWRPSHYGYGRWGFRTDLRFPVVKLLDYAAQAAALETDPNPFAIVVLAYLKTLETRNNPTARHAWKVRLVRGLYERGMRTEDVRNLFRFIDWVMDLPKAVESLFWQEVIQLQEEKQMPYIPLPEQIGMEKGLLEGIEALLDVKFGEEGLKLLPEIRAFDDFEVFRSVLQAIKTANRPEEVRQVWAPKRRSRKKRPT